MERGDKSLSAEAGAAAAATAFEVLLKHRPNLKALADINAPDPASNDTLLLSLVGPGSSMQLGAGRAESAVVLGWGLPTPDTPCPGYASPHSRCARRRPSW